MSKLSINGIIDNTGKIKRDSADAARRIEFVDRTVTPIGKFDTPPSKHGDKVYSVDCRWGFADIVENGAVISVDGRFVRSDEWKPTPWTPTESADYYEHRRAESERVSEATRQSLKAYDQRKALAKTFLGR